MEVDAIYPTVDAFKQAATESISQHGRYGIHDTFTHEDEELLYHIVLCANFPDLSCQAGCSALDCDEHDPSNLAVIVTGTSLEHSEECQAATLKVIAPPTPCASEMGNTARAAVPPAPVNEDNSDMDVSEDEETQFIYGDSAKTKDIATVNTKGETIAAPQTTAPTNQATNTTTIVATGTSALSNGPSKDIPPPSPSTSARAGYSGVPLERPTGPAAAAAPPASSQPPGRSPPVANPPPSLQVPEVSERSNPVPLTLANTTICTGPPVEQPLQANLQAKTAPPAPGATTATTITPSMPTASGIPKAAAPIPAGPSTSTNAPAVPVSSVLTNAPRPLLDSSLPKAALDQAPLATVPLAKAPPSQKLTEKATLPNKSATPQTAIGDKTVADISEWQSKVAASVSAGPSAWEFDPVRWGKQYKDFTALKEGIEAWHKTAYPTRPTSDIMFKNGGHDDAGSSGKAEVICAVKQDAHTSCHFSITLIPGDKDHKYKIFHADPEHSDICNDIVKKRELEEKKTKSTTTNGNKALSQLDNSVPFPTNTAQTVVDAVSQKATTAMPPPPLPSAASKQVTSPSTTHHQAAQPQSSTSKPVEIKKFTPSTTQTASSTSQRTNTVPPDAVKVGKTYKSFEALKEAVEAWHAQAYPERDGKRAIIVRTRASKDGKPHVSCSTREKEENVTCPFNMTFHPTSNGTGFRLFSANTTHSKQCNEAVQAKTSPPGRSSNPNSAGSGSPESASPSFANQGKAKLPSVRDRAMSKTFEVVDAVLHNAQAAATVVAGPLAALKSTVTSTQATFDTGSGGNKSSNELDGQRAAVEDASTASHAKASESFTAPAPAKESGIDTVTKAANRLDLANQMEDAHMTSSEDEALAANETGNKSRQMANCSRGRGKGKGVDSGLNRRATAFLKSRSAEDDADSSDDDDSSSSDSSDSMDDGSEEAAPKEGDRYPSYSFEQLKSLVEKWHRRAYPGKTRLVMRRRQGTRPSGSCRLKETVGPRVSCDFTINFSLLPDGGYKVSKAITEHSKACNDLAAEKGYLTGAKKKKVDTSNAHVDEADSQHVRSRTQSDTWDSFAGDDSLVPRRSLRAVLKQSELEAQVSNSSKATTKAKPTAKSRKRKAPSVQSSSSNEDSQSSDSESSSSGSSSDHSKSDSSDNSDSSSSCSGSKRKTKRTGSDEDSSSSDSDDSSSDSDRSGSDSEKSDDSDKVEAQRQVEGEQEGESGNEAREMGESPASASTEKLEDLAAGHDMGEDLNKPKIEDEDEEMNNNEQETAQESAATLTFRDSGMPEDLCERFELHGITTMDQLKDQGFVANSVDDWLDLCAFVTANEPYDTKYEDQWTHIEVFHIKRRLGEAREKGLWH